ncbi:HIT family protein [Streptomyces sp. DSM 44917]|uniref:HIT family protein n=1 Tax=Streptomyces boetiae TaxID=3075541 RepID=A0ABU2L4V8_9ACTN|nr:HIT family protein [Streptomyces sp. DSM 44917]MDT0306588.1 HIT family protein [Streptomyces sp. DSM 44917]
MDCPFCAVADGSGPAVRVWEDGAAVAFLDTRPLFPGHVLLIPRRHAETLTDLAPEEVGPFFARVRRAAAAVERGTGAQGTFVAMNNRVSQSVPHLHVHVVPRRRKDGLRGFFWPRRPYADAAEAEAVAERLRGAFQEAGGEAGGEAGAGGL